MEHLLKFNQSNDEKLLEIIEAELTPITDRFGDKVDKNRFLYENTYKCYIKDLGLGIHCEFALNGLDIEKGLSNDINLLVNHSKFKGIRECLWRISKINGVNLILIYIDNIFTISRFTINIVTENEHWVNHFSSVKDEQDKLKEMGFSIGEDMIGLKIGDYYYVTAFADIYRKSKRIVYVYDDNWELFTQFEINEITKRDRTSNTRVPVKRIVNDLFYEYRKDDLEKDIYTYQFLVWLKRKVEND